VLDVRVPASGALRVRQRVEARPAATADDAALVRRQWRLADHTDARQEKVGDSGRRAAQDV
jgi:hypothetical protein